MKTLLMIFINIIFSFAFAEQRKALIYDIGKTQGQHRFTQESTIEESKEGERLWSSKIVDTTGKLLMTEKATIKNGKIIYQYIEQLQINESYELKVVDQKATFITYKLSDNQKTLIESKTVDVNDNFVTGPLTELYLQSNWSPLTEGKTVHADFGIFELSKAYGFQFKKKKESEKAVEVVMKPSNFFIALFAPSIDIKFDKKQKRMIHFKGPTPLREMVRGKWKPLAAEIIYLL